ncbi:MAG: hypothetical protein JXJ17_05125 [Anaerolineae bacterium]|nr:hypothetical protein [Anaerolineae bacterium]
MTKADQYREVLSTLDDWTPYLLAESGLPGPRANLELIQVVADKGDQALFEAYLAYGPEEAPVNSPEMFLATCGIVGMGRLLAEGQIEGLDVIRRYANDPRWRMREGVAMALQRLGDRDMDRLISEMEGWAQGSLLEKRAAAAAICEPRLLKNDQYARRTLAILDGITESIIEEEDRRSDDFKALRKGLGYCWSVAVVALPGEGKPLIEKWLACDDKDIRWIVKENLGKARLARMDGEWVEACLARL